jgi:hypothetical protein
LQIFRAKLRKHPQGGGGFHAAPGIIRILKQIENGANVWGV